MPPIHPAIQAIIDELRERLLVVEEENARLGHLSTFETEVSESDSLEKRALLATEAALLSKRLEPLLSREQ